MRRALDRVLSQEKILKLPRRGGRARLKASDSKSDRGVSPSGVQILSPPPIFTRAESFRHAWRGGRVAEGAALEMPCRGNSTVGSNPTPSAIILSEMMCEIPQSSPIGEKASVVSSPELPMTLQGVEKGSAARRRPKAAGEAYSLYVEPAVEGANEADGPLSAPCASWPC